MIIRTAYDRGYIDCEWKKGSPGDPVQTITSEGFQFQEILLRYDLVSKIIHIRAHVVDTIRGNSISLPPTSVTKELLEDFGVVFNTNASHSSNWMQKIIDVMGMLNYWSKASLQGAATYTPQPPVSPHTHYGTQAPYKKTYFPKQSIDDFYLYDPNGNETDKLKKQLEEKDARIRDLEEEIKDMKEEIEMLKALNQEC